MIALRLDLRSYSWWHWDSESVITGDATTRAAIWRLDIYICKNVSVFVRSTLTPGTITVFPRREGLEPAKATIEAKPISVVDGVFAR